MQCQISCASGRRLEPELRSTSCDEAQQRWNEAQQLWNEAQQHCSGTASAADAHETLALLRAALAARRDALQAGAAASFTAEELEELLLFRRPASA